MRGDLQNSGYERRHIREYLLGRLPPAARDALEESWFSTSTSSSFDDIRAADDELVDDYLLGRLSRADRSAFERAYFTTPERTEKVRTAAALLRRLSPAAPATRENRVRPYIKWAAAAMLVLSAGAMWRVARRSAPMTSSLPRSVSQSQSTSPGPVAFALTPGLTRGVGAGQSLRLPAGGDIELDAYVEVSGDQFDADVTTPEGNRVWYARALRLGPDRILRIRIPAERMGPGDYLVSIRSSGGPQPAEAGTYSFRAIGGN
jgi:hypothetical protein